MAMPAKRQPKDAEKETSKSLMDRLAALAREFEQQVMAKRKQARRKKG